VKPVIYELLVLYFHYTIFIIYVNPPYQNRKYKKRIPDGRDAIVEIGLRGDVDLEILNGLKEGQDAVTFME